MSIEAVALTQLLQSIDAAFKLLEDGKAIHKIDDAVKQAKFWVQPLQTHMNEVYKIWDLNRDWSRTQFLAYCKDLPNKWLLRCVILGNMNYHVEKTEGFECWRREIAPGPLDYEVLYSLCTELKTPVGYQVMSCILGAEKLITDYELGDDGLVQPEEYADQLNTFSIAYRMVHYEFLIQVEQRIRRDVPTFGLQTDL